ncbi:MAG: 2-amino-4-hydroxy-6-hydroxymethyldihydropteridine diphosphokinase [Paludibacter sp.]
MNSVLVMLGSNSNAEENLSQAYKKLESRFDIIKQSSILITKPFGKQYIHDFHNMALKLYTNENFDETRAIFKSIEKEHGRTSESKTSGIIPIDIDLIFWNDAIVHQDYGRFEFVRKCIDEVK